MIKRIVIELEEKEHRAIKTKAAAQGKSVREVALGLLKEWEGSNGKRRIKRVGPKLSATAA